MFDISGRFRHDTENQRAQQYMINCTKLKENDTEIYWMNRTYSQTGFQVDVWTLHSFYFLLYFNLHTKWSN